MLNVDSLDIYPSDGLNERNKINMFGKKFIIDSSQLMLILVGYTVVVSMITCIFCQICHKFCVNKKRKYNKIPTYIDTSESDSTLSLP